MKKKLVYICSRYSGDTDANAEKAGKYCRFAADHDAVPIAPHLLFPQFISEETERELAVSLDLELLKRCDEVWVFGAEDGVSDGMAAEISGACQDIRYFDSQCREMFV